MLYDCIQVFCFACRCMVWVHVHRAPRWVLQLTMYNDNSNNITSFIGHDGDITPASVLSFVTGAPD